MPHTTEPLKPHWLQILLALAADARHGSGIMRAVLEQTGGTLKLWPVLLYSSLEQMRGAGLIQEVPAREHPVGESTRRKFYRLTKSGRRALGDEAERLERLAGLAKASLAAARRDA
jgi:DNA-binding PadR family transcriptional regulator